MAFRYLIYRNIKPFLHHTQQEIEAIVYYVFDPTIYIQHIHILAVKKRSILSSNNGDRQPPVPAVAAFENVRSKASKELPLLQTALGAGVLVAVVVQWGIDDDEAALPAGGGWRRHRGTFYSFMTIFLQLKKFKLKK
jgi:hypothetical protein